MNIFKKAPKTTFTLLNEQTTFWGAQMFFDKDTFKKFKENHKELHLSTLAHLAQFIESIILNDHIAVIRPSVVPEYAKYYDKSFLISELSKKYDKEKSILSTFDFQEDLFDINDKLINRAAKSFISTIDDISKKKIKEVLNSRKQTYLFIDNAAEAKNKLTELKEKQLEIAKETLKDEERIKFENKINNLKEGKNFFHVFLRMKLYEYLSGNNVDHRIYDSISDNVKIIPEANYARQPLIPDIYKYDLKPYPMEIQSVTNQKLKELMANDNKKLKELKNNKKILESINPLFLICIKGTKKPFDILDNALKLREKFSGYREDMNKLFSTKNNHKQYIDEFVTILDKYKNIHEFLATEFKDISSETYTGSVTSTEINLHLIVASYSNNYQINRFVVPINTKTYKSLISIQNTLNFYRELNIGRRILNLDKIINDIFGIKINYNA